MSSTDQFIAFLIASFLLIQIPGPSLLFTIGRALAVSRREAFLSAVGNALGLLAQVAAVAFGLGAVVAASSHAHDALKYLGAAYIVWLGIQTIRNRGDARVTLLSSQEVAQTARRSLATGMVVGVTNPKTLVFFVSFLPQFVSSDGGPVTVQLLLLGLIFCVMAVLSDGVWVLAASRARAWFASEPHRLDHLGAAGGVMMIGLGAFIALSSTPAPART